MYKATPIGTPSYKKNPWHANTDPAKPRRYNEAGEPEFENEDEKGFWEREQEQLDRQWYNEDAHDDDFDPFAGMESYTAKKEEQLRLKEPGQKRVSAYSRARNADQDRWEQNRMLTSGAVQRVGPLDEVEDEEEGKVHLLVHHVVPPFLDGRIAFSKQPDPIFPVKDPSSDIAVLSKKGSMLVGVPSARACRVVVIWLLMLTLR